MPPPHPKRLRVPRAACPPAPTTAHLRQILLHSHKLQDRQVVRHTLSETYRSRPLCARLSLLLLPFSLRVTPPASHYPSTNSSPSSHPLPALSASTSPISTNSPRSAAHRQPARRTPLAQRRPTRSPSPRQPTRPSRSLVRRTGHAPTPTPKKEQGRRSPSDFAGPCVGVASRCRCDQRQVWQKSSTSRFASSRVFP